MGKILIALSVESKKLFRSRVPFITLLAYTLLPVSGGFFMFVLKDPGFAEKLGVISAKAHLMGTADWPSYICFLVQAAAIGGMVIFGFTISWIFGREYVDRTLKDLLALPLSRSNIVLSKFIMAALWSLILSLYAFLLGLLAGTIIGLPGWSSVVIGQGAHTFALVSLLTILLSTPVAFFASIGHGYLQPLGFLVFILFFSQIIAATGYGEYFPWSIPALAGGIAGEYGTIERASIIIVIITSALGVVGTAGWWRYADHS